MGTFVTENLSFPPLNVVSQCFPSVLSSFCLIHHKVVTGCLEISILSSLDLWAGVARSVQCLTTDWTAGVRSPTEAEYLSSNLCVQTGSGAHPACCTVGIGGSLSGGKARLGRDADHSPPSSAEVKKE
jgi:hypothetical protein